MTNWHRWYAPKQDMEDSHAFPSIPARIKNCKNPKSAFPKLRLNTHNHHHHNDHAHPKDRMIERYADAEPISMLLLYNLCCPLPCLIS